MQPGTPPRADLDSSLAVATFDSAWSRIGVSYYDSTFRGVDWARIRTELRPRAAAIRRSADLRKLLEEMFAPLGESHFAVIPGDAVAQVQTRAEPEGEPGDVGIELRFVDGIPLVSRVEPGSAAAAAGIRTGWRLDRIDGTDVDSLVGARRAAAPRRERSSVALETAMSIMARTQGAVASTVRLALTDGARRRRVFTVVRRTSLGVPVRYGHLPPQLARLESDRLPGAEGCVGVIRFNTWMTPLTPHFDAAMDELRDCRGIVLDLRGNLGGLAAMVMGVGGHFLDSAVSLGTSRSRASVARYVVNPRRVGVRGQPVSPFAGPMAILVDGLSASTSEIFAAGMQSVGRARVFGETTAGRALPSTLTRLPNGDVMQHVVFDFVGARGERIEGRGVVPDVPLPLHRDDLLAGRDAALAAALRWIDAAGAPATAASLSHR